MFSQDDLLFLAPDQPLRLRGGFARRIFVAVLDEGAPEAARAFLGRVFEAARIQLEPDVLLAEIAPNQPFSAVGVLKEKQPEHVLVFGLRPDQCGFELQASAYQPLYFYQTNLLFADKISVLEPDKAKKGQLWTVMKQWFL